jgi:nitroreductase
MIQKLAQTIYPIHELLRTRWSPRAYATRPVEEEKLLSLFEAARWAPSGGNGQPWAFIVTKRSDSGCYQALLSTLTGQNPTWAQNAPVLVVSVALPNQRTGTLTRFSYYDVGQAVAHLTVQASALGLSVHQMGGFNAEQVRQLLELPEGTEPLTVFAIGYMGEANDLPEALRERELAARTRKPLGEFVFEGRWQQPLEAAEVERAADRSADESQTAI